MRSSRKGWGLFMGAVLLAGVLWFAGRPSEPAPSVVPSRAPVTSGNGDSVREEDARDSSQRGLPLEQSGSTERCQVHGRVTDENDQPLPGLLVEVNDGEGHRSRHPRDSVTTDEKGLYAFESLEPGRYSVSADGPGYVAASLPVDLRSCESRTLDITLPLAMVVRGGVVDEAGHPVGGVRVLLSPPAREGEDDARFLVSTESHEDGTFSLDAPEPGDYSVHLMHPDFLLTRLPVSAPMEGARLVLRSGTNVEAEVVDESGRPLAEVEVSVRTRSDEEFFDGKTGTTDGSGKVTLKGFEPGKYVVVAALPSEGHLRTVKRSVESRRAELLRVRLPFEVGLGLSGVVVDGAGHPVEGARVELAPVREVGPSGADDLMGELELESARPLLTDARGRFTVNHLRPGLHVATVRKEGYVHSAPTEQGVMAPTEGVVVSAGASGVRLVLDFLGLVKGRVVRADGSPVTRFQLNDDAVEDEQGAFQLPIEDDGERVLTFSARDLAGTERKVRVRRGELLDLGDIVLRTGREVRVRVVDAESSRPVSGARLDIRTSDEGATTDPSRSLLYRETTLSLRNGHRLQMSARHFMTNKEGLAVLPHVEPRPLLLVVRHDDFLEARVPLGAEQREVVVPLNAGAWVEGTVRAGTVAVESGTVQLRSPDGEVAAIAAIHEGAYSSGPLKAGRYTLQVGHVHLDGPPPVFFPRFVEVPASGKMTLDLEAARGP